MPRNHWRLEMAEPTDDPGLLAVPHRKGPWLLDVGVEGQPGFHHTLHTPICILLQHSFNHGGNWSENRRPFGFDRFEVRGNEMSQVLLAHLFSTRGLEPTMPRGLND